MIDFNTAIELIRDNGGFKPNKKDTSYYRTYNVQGSRPMQVRVSNHGTWLWTWYDKDYDPSYAINYCIVFSENGNYDSDVSVDMDIKDGQGNVIGQRKTFEVIQYVYNCQLLNDNDAARINQEIQSIWKNKGFEDPFADTPKHAKVMKLKPNEPIEPIVENKNINCNKNMNKKLIRLTESDLHRIVKESVNNVLNEMVDEGQGWDFFKRVRDDYKNGEIDLDDYNQYKHSEDDKEQVRNFINTGDYRGENGNIYRRDKPERRNDLHDSMDDVKRWQGDEAANDYGNINHSLRGKIGRAAGVMGARGYLGYQNLKNKFRRK